MAENSGLPGIKFDSQKIRPDLLPAVALIQQATGVAFGTVKYEEDNWQKIENGKKRYIASAMRHILAYQNGEDIDPDSGLHHLTLAACCLCFAIWFANEDGELTFIEDEEVQQRWESVREAYAKQRAEYREENQTGADNRGKQMKATDMLYRQEKQDGHAPVRKKYEKRYTPAKDEENQ